MNFKLAGSIVVTNGKKETRLEGLDIEVTQAEPNHLGSLFDHLFSLAASGPVIETQTIDGGDTNETTNVESDSKPNTDQATDTGERVEESPEATGDQTPVNVKATVKTKKVIELRPKTKPTPQTEVVETVVQEEQLQQKFEEGWEEYMREKKRKKKRFSPIRNAKRKLIQLLEDDEK